MSMVAHQQAAEEIDTKAGSTHLIISIALTAVLSMG
jgi:hypothetical protein